MEHGNISLLRKSVNMKEVQSFLVSQSLRMHLKIRLILFSNPSDRNLVLSFSKNLKNPKLSIEKHIPKIYQAEYKKFKNIAAKFRLIPDMNCQTQITFDSHLMLLRYKARDTHNQKFQYITHSEFYPPMEQASSHLKSSLHIPPGTVPTPVI